VGALAGALHAVVAAITMAWRYQEQILSPPAVGRDILFDPGSRLLGLVLGLPGEFLQRFYGPGVLAKIPLIGELLVVNVLLGGLVGLALGAGIGRLLGRRGSTLKAMVFAGGFVGTNAVLHGIVVILLEVNQRRARTLRYYVRTIAERLTQDAAADLLLTALVVALAIWLAARLGRAWSMRAAVGAAVAAATALIVGQMSSPGSATGAPAAGATRLPTRPKNVVLVSIDSLRADHLHCYGYQRPTSPTLDRLAAEGARFATAYSVSAWTLPSHATMLTGLYPFSHGAIEPNRRISSNAPTLATELRRTGFATAGFVSYEFLRRRYGFDVGFDLYDDFTTDLDTEAAERTARTGPLLNRQIVPWLEAHRGRPFLLFVHYFDVHWDYDPPPPYDTMFDADYEGPNLRPFLDNPAIHPGMPKRHLEHMIALYDGEIRFTDDVVREVVESLERWGLADDTLLIVTADHGDEFFEHGDVGHNKTLYDEVTRIPLIIRWPRGIAGGRRIDTPVSLVDLAPTVYELLGLDPPPGLEGTSLVPLLVGGERPGRPIYAHLSTRKRRHDVAMVRAGSTKYLQHLGMPRAELYDVAVDPHEKRNRFSAADERPLRDSLLAWLQQEWTAYRHLPREEHQIVVDDHNTAKLRALGYVE
jgi:arylsulfatase A-like enzyme